MVDDRLSAAFGRLGALMSRFAWLVVSVWIVALGALNVALPQLEQVIAENSAAFIPESNEASAALKDMAADFGNPDSSAVGYFVLADESGLDQADRRYYDELTTRLSQMPEHVAYLVDTQTTPEGQELTTSDDGAALTLLTVLNGDNGTTEATQATQAVRHLAHEELSAPSGLDVAFSGPVATTSDQLQAVEQAMLVITGVSIILIAVTLMVAYRRIAVVMIALSILGMSLGVARPVVGVLGAAGVLEMSMFTAALMTALVIGAGTDYAVFVIGRFQEARRRGMTVSGAAADSVGGIATVILASGLTVAAACMSMAFTEVGIFRTAGPPIAVGILVALAVALTLGPALLTVFGRSGRADARVDVRVGAGPARRAAAGRSRSERQWRRRAARVVRRPGMALALAVAVLLPFAALAAAGETNFDEFSSQPADSESNRGYALADEHFPKNELLSEFLIVRADHDLRNSGDLAALERIAQSLADVDHVTSVRSITRPDGDPLSEAASGFQAGVVADGLNDGLEQVNGAADDLDRLTEGTRELADGAGAADEGASRLEEGARELDAGLQEVRSRVPELAQGTHQVTGMARGMLDAVDAAQRAVDSATGDTATLGDALDGARESIRVADRAADLLRANAQAAGEGARQLDAVFGPMLDPGRCAGDPACLAAAESFSQLDGAAGGGASAALTTAIEAGRDPMGSADQISGLAADMTDLVGSIESSLDGLEAQGGTTAARSELARLDEGVTELREGLTALADGGARLHEGTSELAEGTGQLMDGAAELRDGVAQVPPLIDELTAGLGEAGGHLEGMRGAASDGPGAGFYLPDFAFEEPRFVAAADFFLSPDGRTARMMVTSDSDALSLEAIAATDTYRDRAEAAAAGTPLDSPEITVTGFAAVYNDLDDEITADFLLVVVICMVAITLILGLLLRSVVAPLLIAATSLVSYIATIGIGVLVWKYALDTPLHWSVMPLSFVLLVGVGADYSVLAISRIREEAARTVGGQESADGGLRLGVIRGLGSTGGLITTAGVVFAMTMFALMAGGLYLLAQLGFVVGIGLLLDILLVRAVLVPSALVLLGRRSWWPARG